MEAKRKIYHYFNKLLGSILILAFSVINVFAQNGPAGIGNSNGSSGQPENIVWLNADSINTTNGSTIISWPDMSGNENDFSQANTSFSPIYRTVQLNSHNIAEFSQANNRIVLNPFNDFPTDEISVIIVMRTSDSGDGLVSYASSTADNNEFLFYQSNDLRYYVNGSYLTTGIALNDNNWTIFNSKWRSSDGQALIFRDGDNIYSGTIQAGNPMTSGGSFAIGGEQDDVDGGYTTGQAFQGDIAEVIMYNSYLNNAQLKILDNYLSAKYNIALATPANDLFTGHAASYIYDIAGIGQESDGSHLIASSDGLIISENGGMDDGEYVLASHNNTTNDTSSIRTGSEITASGAQAAWAKDWYIEKTGNLDLKISFDFTDALEDGLYPVNVANYVLLYRAGTSGNYSQVTVSGSGAENGDQVYFTIADANYSDGYFTIGTIDQTNSPIQGKEGFTWYTLISGDWDNWEIWTLDPSGSLPNNPGNYTPTTSPTNTADKVVVLSGKTVTVNTGNKSNAEIIINGRLDLTSTVGHSFGEIKGSGRIRLAGDNFPSGDATDFTTEGFGEGTVVYYGTSRNLTNELTAYNLEINLTNSTDQLTLLADYTINGTLQVEQGELQINDNATTNALDIYIGGNLNILSNGKILTGQGNARHQLELYGNLTNDGEIQFTNRTSANYTAEATDGIVDLITNGDDQNQTIQCNGSTRFYRIEIDKGIDKTYSVTIQANDPSNFELFGYANEGHGSTSQLTSNSNALGLIRGTVVIGTNINIPRLNGGGNYNISAAARLWVNGGSVAKTVGTAIVPYGTIQVSSGTLTASVSSGITTRDDGMIIVEGGTLTTNQIRTSVLGAANIGGYVQTGGNVIVTGTSINTDYHAFSLTYPGNVFTMTGGTLTVKGTQTGGAWGGGSIFIASNSGNINVTGGTVIMEIDNANEYIVTSTAPFYNVIMRNTYDATVREVNLSGSTSGNSGDETVLSAQPLVVYNNLTIEDYILFDHNGVDVTVGGDFTIETLADYEYDNAKKNTTTIDDSGNSLLAFYNRTGGSSDEQRFWRLVIDKDNSTDSVKLESGKVNRNNNNNNLLRIDGTAFILNNGVLDNGEHSVRFYTDTVINYGKLGVYNPANATPDATSNGNNDLIKLRPDPFVLLTSNASEFGNVRLNSGAQIVTLVSDVYMQRMQYRHGRVNLGKYNFKLDELFIDLNVTQADFGGCGGCNSVEDMLITTGKASDGGLSIYIPSDGLDATEGDNVFEFPFGIGTTGTEPASKYTPALATLTNVTDDGYITIRPVDNVLATTDGTGGDILSYYWKVDYDSFTTAPTVVYDFTYYDDDLDGSTNEALFVPGKVLANEPFTRSYENDVNKVDDANNTITFDGSGAGFTLEEAEYTAGESGRFVGAPTIFYSNTNSGNWNNNNSWALDRDGTIPAGAFPGAGDVAIIQRQSASYSGIITIRSAEQAAKVIFDDRHGWSSGCPRLIFDTQAGYASYGSNFGTVEVAETHEGGSTPYVSHGAVIQYNVQQSYAGNFPGGDFGDFNNYENALVIYSWDAANGNADITLSSAATEYPIMWFAGGNTSRKLRFPDVDVTVNGKLTIPNDIILLPGGGAGNKLTIKQDLEVGHPSCCGIEGQFLFEGGSAASSVVEVEGDVKLRGSTGSILGIDGPTTGAQTHSLIVHGNITIDATGGLIQLGDGDPANTNVELELTGEGAHSFDNNDSGTSTAEFYRIIMNKGSSTANTFSFNNNFSLTGSTNTASKAIELLKGKLILNDPGINVDLSSGGGDFNIPSGSGLSVDQGQANVYGDDIGIYLDGELLINGGTLDMANGAGNGNNYIEYSSSGNATLDISAGTLLVGSQIRRGTSADEGVLKYTQSGGTVEIGINAAPENVRGVFEILGSGSEFNHTGGSLSIVRQQTSPTIAALHLDPDISTTSSGTTITLGSSNTPVNQDIGIYSSIELKNLTIDNSSTNDPTATLWVLPLTLEENLTIDANAEFDANSLDLIIGGNFTNNGTYTANGNTTEFNGSTDQIISGNTTFYNFIKSSSNTVSLNAGTTQLTVSNEFQIQDGIFEDNGNTIYVKGYCTNDGIHVYGGSGNGIVLDGTAQQYLYGNGAFGKLSINNSNGITVELGNEVTISDALRLEDGVFYIGKNLLNLEVNATIEEASPFSETNMIETNLSFTDNGVKKTLPIGASNFTFPIGSQGKYTPVTFNITANGNSSGSITAKGANEMHPSIIEDSESPDTEIVDADNALQYHWILTADGISNFSATAQMTYDSVDAKVTAPYDLSYYITARLLNDGSGNWYKYNDPTKFDEAAHTLTFDFSSANDNTINGDYTAGVDSSGFNGAIPDQVPMYASQATDDWDVLTTWNPNISGGPRGAMVTITAGDVVTVPNNYISAYTTNINGTLRLNSTFGHRLGMVSGTGTLYTELDAIPAAVYTNFFSASGGTIEYGGNSDIDILSGITSVNNLAVSGTGERRLPNANLTFYGDISINGADLINENDKKITILGDISRTSGTFDAGTGANAILLMQGSSQQTISGSFTGSNSFNILTANNSSGIQLTGDVDIDNQLTLTDGIVITNGNQLRIGAYSSITPSSGSGNAYIDGKLTKTLSPGNSFEFPIGDAINRGNIKLQSVSGFTGNQDWDAEYIYDNATNGGYETDSVVSPLQSVSKTEYWEIEGVSGASATIQITLDGSSDIANSSDLNNLRIVSWNGTHWEIVGGTPTITGNASSGTVTTTTSISFDGTVQKFSLGSIQSVPLATATITSADQTICNGDSYNVDFALTGTAPWQLIYNDGSQNDTISGIATSPHQINLSPTTTTTYTIQEISDLNGIGSTYGKTSITITVVSTITATINSSNVTCNGSTDGSISITSPSGGSGTYEYTINGGSSWQSSGDFNGLAQATYDVRIRDAVTPTCVYTLNGSLNITEPAVLNASISATNVSCNGNSDGIIDITGETGGGGTYEFTINGGTSWQASGTFNTLSANTYDVRIRDAAATSCVITLNNSLTISQPAVLNASVASSNVTCNGGNDGSITISSPTGGGGTYEYTINGGTNWQASGTFNTLSAATYDVRIRDAAATSCVITLNGSLAITEPAAITVNLGGNQTECSGTVITLDAGAGYTSYNWSKNSTPNYSTNQTINLSNVSDSGDYNVTVQNASGCVGTSNTVTITINQTPAPNPIIAN